jgi:hypothetical protein
VNSFAWGCQGKQRCQQPENFLGRGVVSHGRSFTWRV